MCQVSSNFDFMRVDIDATKLPDKSKIDDIFYQAVEENAKGNRFYIHLSVKVNDNSHDQELMKIISLYANLISVEIDTRCTISKDLSIMISKEAITEITFTQAIYQEDDQNIDPNHINFSSHAILVGQVHE